jgi:hypothetical protein
MRAFLPYDLRVETQIHQGPPRPFGYTYLVHTAPAYPLGMDPEMTCVCGRPMQIVAVHQFAGLKGPMKLLVYSCGQSPVEDGGDHLQLREVPA